MIRTAILLIAVALSALAQSDGDEAARSKIVALEQLWNQAYKSGDTKALESILDDGIVLVNDDGSVQTKANSRQRKVIHAATSSAATAGRA